MAAIVLGWTLMTVVLVVVSWPIGGLVSVVVAGYMAWTYPLSCEASVESVRIRSLLRMRNISWSQVYGIRRTKGAWGYRTVAGKRRLRPAPGAIMLMLAGRRSVLVLGHVESRTDNASLVAVVERTSAALADSLRLTPVGPQ